VTRPGKLASILITALVVLSLTGCGDDDGEAADTSTKPGMSDTIDVTFEGDTVTPNGERVEVEHGKPVTLNVTADKPGEIHVHSTPEQELEYGEGKTTLELTLDQPGVVDVESHTLDKVIVQLEVR
jgi:hypothetical protein